MLKIASFFLRRWSPCSLRPRPGRSARPDEAWRRVAEVVELKATVTAVDRADRTVTLRGEDGSEVESP